MQTLLDSGAPGFSGGFLVVVTPVTYLVRDTEKKIAKVSLQQ
jgi:hypothetical protein